MEYDIKSKPTVYKNVKFRSRLEARWAAFFDLIGWRWQYEAYDFNGWTPDFAVYGSAGSILFIEVKPIVTIEYAREYSTKLKHVKPTVNAIMISPEFDECKSYGSLFAGYQISHKSSDNESHYYRDGEFLDVFEVHWKDNQRGINSEYDIGSCCMSYDGILWSCDNRKNFISDFAGQDKEIKMLWLKAQLLTSFSYA